MMNMIKRAAALVLAASCLPTSPALVAQDFGPGHPRPQAPHTWPGTVRVTSLRVRAAVHDGVASTEIDQVLHNDAGRDAEATWILPLPADATADDFTMTVGDKEVAGEVLDAGRARGIYEQIVRQRRDPGLLEYFGEGCLRARVFPIPPGGDVVVKVRFRHPLPRHGGMYEWRFPLRALVAAGMRPQRTSLDLHLTSSKPIKNILSPHSGIDFVRRSECEARAALELGPNSPLDRDLQVLYSLSDDEFGLNALSYRRAGEDGYFMLVLSPRREDSGADKTMRYVQFVLDTSGSMAGRKIEQAKSALRFFLRSLRSHDRFNVIPFATEAEPFFATPPEATATALETALAKVDAIQARGGTNIEDALTRALTTEVPQGSVPLHVLPIVVFLTDGAPTVGQTDREKLLAAARQLNRHQTRVFVFGVGNDVDTKLLDRLADDNGGTRDYVREDEDIEVKTSDLFAKLSHPALTDLSLALDGIDTHDVHPKRLPDLFLGSQLTVLGRYTGSGRARIRLTGVLGDQRREFTYDAEFPAQDTRDDFVPTLWAQRKIAQLLDAIRLNGSQPELLREVQRLAKEFGIVTPFTSHLIVEEGMRLAGGAPIRRAEANVPRADAGGGAGPGSAGPGTPGPTSGDDEARVRLGRLGKRAEGEVAVADSLEIKAMKQGQARPARETAADAPVLARRVGHRTFFRVGDAWVDGACKADWVKSAQKIEAYSAAYFELLAANADLKEVLALGEHLVLQLGERVLEIVPPPGR